MRRNKNIFYGRNNTLVGLFITVPFPNLTNVLSYNLNELSDMGNELPDVTNVFVDEPNELPDEGYVLRGVTNVLPDEVNERVDEPNELPDVTNELADEAAEPINLYQMTRKCQFFGSSKT